MRIAVYGAGAVGGHFAARLAAAGHEVSIVVRGAALAAIRVRGLTLLSGPERLDVRVKASDDPADLGHQDLVISTLKSSSLHVLAEGVQPLLAPDTPVVFAQNGIPWWYAHGLPQSPLLPRLGWLDPGGALEEHVGLRRTIGGVIFSSNEVMEPGVVRNDSPEYNALFVGEPDRSESDRIVKLRTILADAGLASPSHHDLREVLWRKLIANMTVSVLCMITGQTAREAVEDPIFGDAVPRLMAEAVAIAAAQGYSIPPMPPGYRAPDHKPSLLQDFLLGRTLEMDALVKAPMAFAQAAGLASPTLDMLGALAQRLAANAGLYRPVAAAG
ncbi:MULTISPECIES: ketopantoate reductase family protein [Sphingobium]|uniref:2-dehydropantoate 2-reductase n=1 Tax=Sphingobium indicum F2 TaxID=1450518 RepID=A0A8E0WQL3_9SPHN|nr:MULTISPECIES: ketopantoate reductase family protein [Sphingobium]KER35522.1 2-dehydropantoate 2-reductase [Sphingobium indicum F2]